MHTVYHLLKILILVNKQSDEEITSWFLGTRTKSIVLNQ
jgi:hypothetical protein